jgi:ferric-dicitrate binding protein FerR (iron transport regulator)
VINKEYQDYTVEDFLLDESFQAYCLQRRASCVTFWDAWISAHPEKQDEVRQARELCLLLNGDGLARFSRDRQAFRVALEQHIGQAETEKAPGSADPGERSRVRKMLLYAGSAAACVALVAAIALWPVSKPHMKVSDAPAGYTLTAKAGERKSFRLPDGSRVILNAGSTFTVSPDFDNQARQVNLEGEAFFDVTHNPAKPFTIHTPSMIIRVLGTVFNVRAYRNDKTEETALLNGSVEVTLTHDHNKKVILHPNEKIVLANPEIPVQAVPAPEHAPAAASVRSYNITGLTYAEDSSRLEISWTRDQLAFNDNSFDEIAGQLERWYNVSVRFEDEAVKQYRFTATFEQKTITQVLDALQLSRPFHYSIDKENSITIRK